MMNATNFFSLKRHQSHGDTSFSPSLTPYKMNNAGSNSPRHQPIQHQGRPSDPFIVCSPLECRTDSSIKLNHENEKDTTTSASYLAGIDDVTNLVNINRTPQILDSVEIGHRFDFMSSNMAMSGKQVLKEAPPVHAPYPIQGHRLNEGRAGIRTRNSFQPSREQAKVWEDNTLPSAAPKAMSGEQERKQARVIHIPYRPQGNDCESEGIRMKDTSLVNTEPYSISTSLGSNVFFFHKLKRTKKKRTDPASSVAVISPPKKKRSVLSANPLPVQNSDSNSIHSSQTLSNFDCRKQCLEESQSLLELYMPIRVDPASMDRHRAKGLNNVLSPTRSFASPIVTAGAAVTTIDGSISRLDQILAHISTPGHVMSTAEITSVLNAFQEVHSQLLAAVQASHAGGGGEGASPVVHIPSLVEKIE